MMISRHGNDFCITGPLWGESIADRWIPLSNGQSYGALMFTLLLAWMMKLLHNRWIAGDAMEVRCHGINLVSVNWAALLQ